MTVGSLARQEVDISRLPQLDDHTSELQSSYDRTGGNKDWAQFLSGDSKHGVLLDRDGPGAVVRIWSANPTGQIKIFIDNNPSPVVDVPFKTLFDGTQAPFNTKLCGASSGGWYCYLPITYAKHCKITLDDSTGIYYQVNTETFKPGTQVESFKLPLTPDNQADVDKASAIWSGQDSTLPAMSFFTVPQRIPAHGNSVIGYCPENGKITRVVFSCPTASDADLRHMVLRASFDDHTTPDIEAPVADFFGDPFGRGSFQTMLLHSAKHGEFSASFPMPFGKSARFWLENGTDKEVQIYWDVLFEHGVFDPNREGYFHAVWSEETTSNGHPHPWLHVTGQRGKLIGIVQTMQSHGGLGYLEGDDQIRVDSQSWLPSQVKSTVIGPWNGTGTEDCFNSGWYFLTGPNSLPTNAVLVKDNYQGRIDCMRWFINDAPIFQHSINAQIEHGGANDSPGVYYSSVTYWYSDGPVQPWYKMPPASDITLPPLRAVYKIPNAIEGEDLVPTAKLSAGNVRVQYMGDFDGNWSSTAQLFWVGAKPNDHIDLTFNAPAAGNYDLTGYFTRANNYGQLAFEVNGQPLKAAFDGYAQYVTASGAVKLGRVALSAGSNTLTCTIAGKNAASANYLLGLDAITIRPVR